MTGVSELDIYEMFLVYASVEAFSYGFSYLVLALIGVCISIFYGCSGFVVKRLRDLNLMTIPEYFEHRYSKRLRVFAGLACALSGILNMGLFPKMGAIFNAYSTGIGSGDPVMVNIITSVLILLVLVYTVLGGMVSVLIMDYIQFTINLKRVRSYILTLISDISGRN